MHPLFVDTNVFIRFLTQDDLGKAASAKSLLDRVESGELTIVISESIVVEIGPGPQLESPLQPAAVAGRCRRLDHSQSPKAEAPQ